MMGDEREESGEGTGADEGVKGEGVRGIEGGRN